MSRGWCSESGVGDVCAVSGGRGGVESGVQEIEIFFKDQLSMLKVVRAHEEC
jgi:hypothetical protein